MKVNNSDILARIHAETLNLIITYGVKGWTMDTVCKRSGLARDTLYRIIGNKEDLINSVFQKVLTEHNYKISELLDQDQEFYATLRDIVMVLSEFLARFSLEKLNQIFIEYPSVEKSINGDMENFFVKFERFLDDGKRAGQLKENVDPQLLVKITHACIMQILKQPEKFNATEDIKTLLDYLIDGIKARAK